MFIYLLKFKIYFFSIHKILKSTYMSIKYLFFFFLTEKMVMKTVMVDVSGENKTILILSPTGTSYSSGSTGRSS